MTLILGVLTRKKCVHLHRDMALYPHLSAYTTCVCLHPAHANLQRIPSSAITPTNSKPTHKQHYLKANLSHGERQLQTLHVIPPCHIGYTHLHTHRDTPLRSPTRPAHFLTISSLSFPTPPSLHVILCHPPCVKLH